MQTTSSVVLRALPECRPSVAQFNVLVAVLAPALPRSVPTGEISARGARVSHDPAARHNGGVRRDCALGRRVRHTGGGARRRVAGKVTRVTAARGLVHLEEPFNPSKSPVI